MTEQRIINSDTLKALKNMPDESVDCVMTSPPYWALRDYGVEGQLGLEPTFQEFITKLCNIFDEIKRVLKKTGTCWVNLGDTYGGTGHSDWSGNDSWNTQKLVNNQDFKLKKEGIPQKSLCLIPERFAIEMVNRGWILRNTIIWYKPNVMPSSAKDRFTVDFEKVFFFVKSKKYWFETQYEAHSEAWLERIKYPWHKKKKGGGNTLQSGHGYKEGGSVDYLAEKGGEYYTNPLGRNKRCVWEICPQPFPEAHFAVFPEKLVETPIKAGCPEQVCRKCGFLREKVYESGEDIPKGGGASLKYAQAGLGLSPTSILLTKTIKEKKEVGLTSCSCNAGWDKGIVLDPFMGSGTVLVVARKLRRNAVGIELKPEYCEMAQKRLNKLPVSLDRFIGVKA